ncbi:MAG: YbaK/EbsC family protein [Alphaproteobacteria bacterium]|nr:YbaK/EbsC family protein [Alphaproteobacteria bacterium]
MSKSLKRVKAALAEAGLDIEIVEMAQQTKTAAEAAAAAGCEIDQIVKSIIFRGATTNRAHLFLTAGGNRVDTSKAERLLGEPLGKADAQLIRAQTGFAIGGVSPLGHLSQIRAFMDVRLFDFPIIWAAAGTPRHNFPIDPRVLSQITNSQITDFTS